MRWTRVGVVWNASKQRRGLDAFVAAMRAQAPTTAVQVYATRRAGDAEAQAASALADGAEVLVAAGGDGTLLGTLNADAQLRRPLTCLPLGVGNDFARMLQISGPEQAAAAVCTGAAQPVDVGEARFIGLDGAPARAYFCSTAGVGAMARVFAYERRPISQRLKTVLGDAIWPLLTLRSFLASPLVTARVTWNDETELVRLSTLELSKVVISGGACFTPDAALDSGHFDVWTFSGRGLADFLRFTRRLFRGDRSHLSLPFVGYRAAAARLRRISITPEASMYVHLNGELVGTAPAQFEIAGFTVPALARPVDGT